MKKNRLIRAKAQHAIYGWSEYRFDQIVGYDVVENGGSVTKGGGIGGAVVGGALFGTAGAIVGGLSGKQQDVVTDMSFVIQLRDAEWPIDTITLHHSSEKNGIKKSSATYSLCQQLLQELSVVLNRIIAQNQAESSAPAPTGSVADEVKKLKELLDAGILTEEEFSEVKKRLLGM